VPPRRRCTAIASGAVKLSVVSPTGKEAVVAMLQSPDFFGECAMAGQRVRVTSAKTMMPTTLWRIAKAEMERALKAQADFSHRFLRHMLERNIRIEEDFVNQLFNSTEKRLARTLLLLAANDKSAITEGRVAKVSQATLAEVVGTTRPRINFFLNKFRKEGLIEYNGGLKVHEARLSRILRAS
jgi:CRP/FNR family transcriptional regulator, cyclic AMP receptor protein